MPPVAQQFQDYQAGADDDGRIGDVKSVPVMAAEVKIDEVGDAVAQHAVEDVARRAAQNQRQAALAQPAAGAARDQQPCQQTRSRRQKKESAAARARAFRESASRPKATPGLLVCTRFKTPGISTRDDPTASELLNGVLRGLVDREQRRAARRAEHASADAAQERHDAALPTLGAAVALDFGERGEAALAQRRIVRAFAHVRRIIPAALAFLAVRALGADLQFARH